MEGWKEYKIKDYPISIIDGDRGKNYPNKSELLKDGYCVFLNTGNVSKNGFVFSNIEFITKEKDEKLRKGKLNRNDIVLTTRGTIGNIGYFGKSIEYNNIRINSGMVILRPDITKLNPNFFFQLMKSSVFSEQAKIFKYGAAQPQLPIRSLEHIKLPLPPLPTQRKIAKILSAYDDLIENNLKRIKLLEVMAQNEFNEWYANNNDFEEVNLGSIIGHEIGGGWGAEEQSEEFSEPAYVIRGTDIDELPNGKIEKVPFRYHKKSNLASRKLQDGDIIFEVSGGSSYEGVAKTLLITVELLKQFDNAVMPASFCKLVRPNERKYSHFLFLFLRFLRKIKGTEVFEIRSASNIVNYNWTAFLKFQKIKKPSDKELEKLNRIVEPIYKQIYNLGYQNQRLKEARDILLPRLMTGMIDVEKMDIKV